MSSIETTIQNLKNRGFTVSHFQNIESANHHILKESGERPVGIGGSMTVQEMDLYSRLKARGDVYWHWESPDDPLIRQLANAAPVYIMSANGVSESGLIINIDGKGNRVANMCWGHEKLFIVIGTNKIAPNDDLAMWRARNVASPKNARRFQYPLPCVPGEDFKCHDCDHPQRICNVFVTLERKPSGIDDVEIVIVDEALGY